MRQVVHRRASARQDLIAIYRHYAREAGLRVADRFLISAEETFKRLAAMPAMGTLYPLDHPALADLRYLCLSSHFKVHVVFYLPEPDGITVVRVLHGARDLDGILSDEFGISTENPPQA